MVLLAISLLLISGCAQQEKLSKGLAEGIEKVEMPSTPPSQGLGNLCSGEEECRDFCQNNRGQCEEYCKGNENELCLVIFLPEKAEEVSGSEQDTKVRDRGPSSSCSDRGPIEFTSPPMRIEDIELIQPIGLMIGSHVTPIDHGYYYSKNWNPSEGREDPSKFKNIFAPADGVITGLGRMPQEFTSSSIGDYRLTIGHSCTFYTIYIHINELSPKLQAVVDGRTREQVFVKAGELLGRSPAFDFSVHDEKVILPGFIVPEHYNEPWKIHTVDMFAYFVEPIKSQLLEKNVRQKEPRGGKIDYDIDGKLVGNWFLEGTNWYAGAVTETGGKGYWLGHLSIVYDYIDPERIVLSIGNYGGKDSKQFGVKGNSPNPVNVGIENSLVKYELVEYDYITSNGNSWDRISLVKGLKTVSNEMVRGVVLVQMISDRKIKFEAFSGKTASQVSGFTENAKIYER